MSTATVEVMTAKVRALMVGSRQITLSVFRQLDWVSIEQIQVMGRVNDEKSREFSTDILVVGSDKSGSLCRSGIHKPDMGLTVCVRRDGSVQGWCEPREAVSRTFRYDGESFHVLFQDDRDTSIDGSEPPPLSPRQDDQINTLLVEQARIAREQARLYRQANDSPLIVLAGLK